MQLPWLACLPAGWAQARVVRLLPLASADSRSPGDVDRQTRFTVSSTYPDAQSARVALQR